MRKVILSLLIAAVAISCSPQKSVITDVPFTQVHFNDSFWLPRIETIRTVTIPYAFERSEKAGYIDNFAIAGGLKEGKYQSVYPFDDAEVFKIIEGAAYLLSVEKDPKLENYLDSVINIVVSAQEADGYLYTNRTINNPLHPWVGKERWETDWDASHETFNAGELYEAGIAYYYATGKRKLLNAAIKNADLICEVFNENGLKSAPGHEVIEMALVRLYHATGDEKYLRQSRFFIETRGHKEHPNKESKDLWQSGKYWQDHLPPRQQFEAVGHAVRATYLYSGMADIAALMDDKEYLAAIDSIWNNIVSKKFYITGGLGARAHGEAFGENYELPNSTAYCETCASIGNCMFNLRMFKLHGDSKYIDVLERSLYNNTLSGISTDGKQFFYPNSLEVGKNGQERSLWFDCSCCPTNLSRFIPAVPGYVYAEDASSIYVNLFVGSTADIMFDGKKVAIEQKTNYPWSGDVEIIVDPAETKDFNLKVRIPGWAQNEAVPSDLYTYANTNDKKTQITVNGKPYDYKMEKGYAVIKANWEKGDIVSVSFPMDVRQVVSNPLVVSNVGKTAVERGPIVYCAEFADNNGSIQEMSLPVGAEFSTFSMPDFVNGIEAIEAKAVRNSVDNSQKASQTDCKMVLIPYFARAYRGAGELSVWLPTTADEFIKKQLSALNTFDSVIIGNAVSEKAHNLKGENTRTDPNVGWRDADNGWFSYDMKIPQDKPFKLVLTYRSHDGGNRLFDILVDNTKIADQRLRTETFDKLLESPHKIPVEFTKGKDKITVKLQAVPGNIAGGLYGCKIVLED